MATISTPARQPFGVLNESKLRSLQSVKNRQNALTPTPSHNLKRRAPSPEVSDSENIDPYQIDLSTKRKRAAFDDDVSLAKQPRLTYSVTSNIQTYTPPPVIRHVEPVKTSSAPSSAPPAAGRSPTRLHNRYEKTLSKRRFAPPSLKSSSPSISIAAALRGTLAYKRSSKKKKLDIRPDDSQPKSWFFDIFEESEEQQDYRMSEWTMTQSSAALEISDDESKGSCFDDKHKSDKGKENVDPNEMLVTSAPVTRSAAAAMALENAEEKQDSTQNEEPRTPLGDLNAADFYAEGLDATSVVLVHDDTNEEGPVQEQPDHEEVQAEAQAPVAEDFTFEAPLETRSEVESTTDLTNEPIPEWALQATIAATTEHVQQEETYIYCDADVDTNLVPAEIEIWESESAKDENENQDYSSTSNGCVIVGEGQTISLSAATSSSGGCYLQEL